MDYDRFFDELNSYIDKMLASSKRKNEDAVDSEILNKQQVLERQLNHNTDVLKTSRDLAAMYYVKTLELIRDVVVCLRDNKKNLSDEFYLYYNLILSEIEPALDDLTLDSLCLVIEQYKEIAEIEKGLKYSEHQKFKTNINRRHEQFQKIITSHKK